MTPRRSVEVPGLTHQQPIPTAAIIGPFLATSGVAGIDPATGAIAPDIEAQCAQLFANLRLILAHADTTPERILKLTVWVKDRALRAQVNVEWLRMFPDPSSRPARHSMVNPDLPAGVLVQAEMLAVLPSA